MKSIFKKLFRPIANFFNRMVDREAERVIGMYRQVFQH